MSNKSDLENLKEFLLDINCLSTLEERPFNAFDVLKISRAEIRHSNMLAWLFDPNETHGLGADFLSAINAYLAKYNYIPNDKWFKVLMMNYSDITVYREWKNIDILVVSEESKYVLCIENKVDTQDHGAQLDTYYEVIEKKYGEEYTKIYLYLSPAGLTPNKDSHEAWGSIKYEAIVETLKDVVKKHSREDETIKFINSYLEILERETMQDNEIVRICQEIYKKHKDALDLIYENRPDRLLNVSEYFKEWCRKHENEILWEEEDEKKSIKSYTRFRTQRLELSSIPKSEEKKSGWKTKNFYYYEIAATCANNEDVSYAIQLVFSIANMSDEDRAKVEKIATELKSKKYKYNKIKSRQSHEWKTVYKSESKTFKGVAELPDITKENEIFKNLNDLWSKIKSDDIEAVIEKHFS